MAFEPLIDRLPANAHRLGGLSLRLANGEDQEDRPATKGFLGVAANAAEIIDVLIFFAVSLTTGVCPFGA